MRYLSMIRVDESTGQQPSEQLMNDMGKLMEEMMGEGKLIRTAGLRPTSEGFRVRLHDGKLSTVDGPFAEAKELIGGYFIVSAGSLDEAEAIAAQSPNLPYGMTVEVRPIAQGCHLARSLGMTKQLRHCDLAHRTGNRPALMRFILDPNSSSTTRTRPNNKPSVRLRPEINWSSRALRERARVRPSPI